MEEKVDNTGMENYYRYIVEQLEYVEMITSTFDVKMKREKIDDPEIDSYYRYVDPIISRETAQRCKVLAGQIMKNLEDI